jgi:asparagine synthase (glutamine-hydrolysing)
MCGIAGAAWFGPQQRLAESVLACMMQRLEHRGPDERGRYRWPSDGQPAVSDAGAALGFQRLAIIDVATGQQPVGNRDGSIQVVFNGEIFNYQELRESLRRQGYPFRGQSDSEVIPHLYQAIGSDCFSHFNGMFAIGLWDSTREALLLARDSMGKKPLYYHHRPGRLVFASELKSLLEAPGVQRRIDPEALDLFLALGYIPHPWTIYQGVRKLAPGQLARFDRSGLQLSTFWQLPDHEQAAVGPDEAAEQLRALLTDSVRLRLQSEVPLGAFLSGGIDSSLVAAIAQQLLGQRGERLRTFAIGFSESSYDETAYARQVADHLGTEHTRFEVGPQQLGQLEEIVTHYDEPFGDSSALPTWALSKLTRTQVTVALSGDGGDELFAGYDRYRALRLSQRLAGWLPLRQLLGSRWFQSLPTPERQRSTLRRLQRFGAALGEPASQRYLMWLQQFPWGLRKSLYRLEFQDLLPANDLAAGLLEQAWQVGSGRDWVSRASLSDLQLYLPGDLMTKVDIASMAHSLEVRQPLLDQRLIDWAAGLPVGLKMRSGRGKWLLWKAFADELPASVWNRPKMGFGVPLPAWFRGPLRQPFTDLVLAPEARIHQVLQPAAVRRLAERHWSGTADEGYRLWCLLVLEMWWRRWEPIGW